MMNGVVLHILVLEFISCFFNVEFHLFSVKSGDPGREMLVFNPLGCATGCHSGVIFLPFSGNFCGFSWKLKLKLMSVCLVIVS